MKLSEMSDVLIQCVVVIYKCSLSDSSTMQSLAEFCRKQPSLAQQMALLIYDNSPQSSLEDLDYENFGKIEYRHDPENGGLAPAYNHALSIARQNEIQWLLLLDQDTVLDPAFFTSLFTTISAQLPNDIAAIVPKLMRQERVFSPQTIGRFHNVNCPVTLSGISPKPVTALNSAACLRVAAVDSVGGFAKEYWLDLLDHVMFHRLQAVGGRVLILDISIEHRLSVHNLKTEMPLDRYAGVLVAEWRFIRETGSGGGPFIHRLRLLKRAFVQTAKWRDRAYARKTLYAAFK